MMSNSHLARLYYSFFIAIFIMVGLASTAWSQLPLEYQETIKSEQDKTLILEHKSLEQPQVEIIYEDKVKEAELHDGILKSLKETYPGFKLSEAYRGNDGSYKILVKKDENTIALFYNSDWEFLRIEKEEKEENRNDWR